MVTFERWWTRHLDILQFQEATLSDEISCLGYDWASYAAYDADGRQESKSLSLREAQAFKEADSKNNLRAGAGAGAGGVKVEGGGTNRDHKEVIYVEEVVEEDSEGLLQGYEEEANRDVLVLSYHNSSPPIDQSKYPASFANVTPISVLRALYYCSAKERKTLTERYGVLPVIGIMMALLAKNPRDFPHHSDKWSFAKRVHPLVRLALYNADNRVQMSAICSHYHLPSEICQFTDFGDGKSVLETNLKVRAGRQDRGGGLESLGGGARVVSEAEMKEAEEEEEDALERTYPDPASTPGGPGGNGDADWGDEEGAEKRKRQSAQWGAVRRAAVTVSKGEAEDEGEQMREKRSIARMVRPMTEEQREQKRRRRQTREQGAGGGQEDGTDEGGYGSDSSDTHSDDETAGTADADAEGVGAGDAGDAGGNVGAGAEAKDAGGMEAGWVVVGEAGEVGEEGDVEEEKSPCEDSDVEVHVGAEVDVDAGTSVGGGSGSVSVGGDSVGGDTIGEDSVVVKRPKKAQEVIDLLSDDEVEDGGDKSKDKSKDDNDGGKDGGEGKDGGLDEGMSSDEDFLENSDDSGPRRKRLLRGGAKSQSSRTTRSNAVPNEVIELSDDDSSKEKSDEGDEGWVRSAGEGDGDEEEDGDSGKGKAKPRFVPKKPTGGAGGDRAGTEWTGAMRAQASGVKTTNTSSTSNGGGGTAKKTISDFFGSYAGSASSLKDKKFDRDMDREDRGWESFEDDEEGGIRLSSKKGGKRKGGFQLSEQTKLAQSAEKRRRKEKLQYTHFSDEGGLAMNVKRPANEPAVMVIDAFNKELKQHQKEGLQFIWENVVGSISTAQEVIYSLWE
ncbi:hypothetical protein B484DRAFT_32013 [Ochromonadaceae sp. CCMP2298]|nr:hypothetical protein B484DRAFT_32013 [Ochromonadaceae sp. CCMP2298]